MKKAMHVTIEEEVLNKIIELAEEERRTMSSMVEYILHQYVVLHSAE